MRRRKQLYLSTAMGVLAFSVVATQGQETVVGLDKSIFRGAVLVVIALGVVLSFLNWRCPACNEHLGRSLGPKVCRGCGIPLA